MKTKGQTVKVLAVLLSATFLFACVKQHPDRTPSTEQIYAIPELNPSDLKIKSDEGEAVGVLPQATYFVQDDFVGCRSTDAALGTLADGDKTVVALATGENAACVKPASLPKMKERPPVTFFKAPQSKPYKIYTRGKIRNSARTESPEGVEVKGNIGIKILNVVDYTTNSPLLNAIKDRIELRAEPYSEYEVYHKITPTHLFIMKVGTKNSLSHLDLPISDNMGNGKYAVPIAVVPITVSNYRANRNADGDKTNVFKFETLDSLKTATHIKFDINDFNAAGVPDQFVKDMYPSDYFLKGLWYVSESVVETRPGSEGFIGTTTGSFDMELRQASLVQFTRSSSGLVACNVGVDRRFSDDPNCVESATVLTIPATGHAYTMNSKSSEVFDVPVLSQEAPFLKLNFIRNSSAKKNIEKLFSVFSILDSREDQLAQVSFEKDKFSFIVERGDTGLRVMYSFLRADNRPEYKERRHYKDDRLNKFGYFVQRKAKIIAGEEISQEEDLEKDYLIQRHNPTKDIYFAFSTITPKYGEDPNEVDPFKTGINYRELGRQAVDYWNAAFEKAGAPNRVRMAEEDAQYGDISANTINLIDSERGSNLLGVGPSLTDPYTGEVINTNANVYIAPFREIVASRARAFIRSRLGYYKTPQKNVPKKVLQNSSLLTDFADSFSGTRDFVADLIPEELTNIIANFYHHGVSSMIAQDMSDKDYSNNGSQVMDLYTLRGFNSENKKIKILAKMAQRVPELVEAAKNGHISLHPRNRKQLLKLEEAFEIERPTFFRSYFASERLSGADDFNSLTREIDQKCTQVKDLIAKASTRARGGLPEISTEEELPAIRHCMSQIIPGKLLSTLVHEMGHNLGLRHNFLGSTDENNFFNSEEVKEIYGLDIPQKDLPRSSTVMEYIRTEQDRLFFPGHYDIAAIRYAYAGKVELDSELERPNTEAASYVDLTKGSANEKDGSIVDELAGKTPRGFKYCTDSAASLQVDPMCARHDFGVTPALTVENDILSYWESLIQGNYRYDRLSAGITGPFRRMGTLQRLKRFYNEWRSLLRKELSESDSTGSDYLERYDVDGYKKMLAGLMAEGSDFKGKDYFEVRNRIFDFLMEITFLSNQYCLVDTPVGPKAMEFSVLKDELRNHPDARGGLVVRSCEDDLVQRLIADKGYKYRMSTGMPVNNMWYEIHPLDTVEESVTFRSNRANVDVVGTYFDRLQASSLLAGRQTGFTGLLESLFPSMLDEPDLYQRYEQEVLKRILGGADLRKAFRRFNGSDKCGKITQEDLKNLSVAKIKQKKTEIENCYAEFSELPAALPNFSEESALLKSMWAILESGTRNPYANTVSRQVRFRRLITDDLNQIQQAQQQGGIVLNLGNGQALVVQQDAEVAFALAKAFIDVSNFLSQGNQQLPAQADVVNAFVQAVAPAAAQLPATELELTAEQYLEYSRAMVNLYRQVQDPIGQIVMDQVFVSDIMLYAVVLMNADTAIQQAAAQGQPAPEGAQEFIDKTLKEWNQKGMPAVMQEVQAALQAQGQPIQLSLPTANSLKVKIERALPSVTGQAIAQEQAKIDQINAVLKVHGDEIFAQRDLLQSILVFDYSEIAEKAGLFIADLVSDQALDIAESFGSYDNYVETNLSYKRALAGTLEESASELEVTSPFAQYLKKAESSSSNKFL